MTTQNETNDRPLPLKHHHYPLSWKWIWTSLCILLVFHFLPATLVQFFQLGGAMYSQLSQRYGEAIWILGGLATLTGLIGYISNGRVIETALASGIYMMFLSRVVPSGLLVNSKFHQGGQILFLILAFVVGGLGTYIGSMIHIHKLVRLHQINPPEH